MSEPVSPAARRFASRIAVAHLASGGALAAVLLPAAAWAQITLVPEPPLPGRLRMGDVWNATVSQPGPSERSAFLRVQVHRDGAVVFDARSGVVSFAPGSRSVRSRDLGAIEVLRTDAAIDEALSRSGAFPDGRYTVCLEAFDPGGLPLGAGACTGVEVATVMPPMPMEPPNGGATSQPFILWTWFMQPATSAGEPVVCDLRVAEVLSGQTPEEALRANPAVLLRENLRSSAWQTNEAVRALRHGATYAWRLTAKVADRVASESEIWTFTYLAPESDEAAPGGTDGASAPAYVPIGATSGAAPAPPADSATAPGTPRPIEWKAAARTTLESSNRPGTLSQRSAKYGRLELDPTLAIYGSPLALRLLLSTERDPRRSGIERGSLGLDGANRGLGLGLHQRIDGRVTELVKSRTELLADSARQVRDDLERVEAELAQLHALRQADPSQAAQELQQLGLVTPGEAAVFRIPSFAFGSVAPDFGRLLLSGVTVNGGMVEHATGRLYGAVAAGKLAREDNGLLALPVDAADGSRAELFQDLVSARLGIGRRSGDHLILSGLYARDDRQTRAILSLADPTRAPAVQENAVVGLAGRLRRGTRLVLDGDVQASLFSDDRDAPEARNRPSPAGLRALFRGRIRESSSADWAGGLRGALDLARWNARLHSGVRFVGPGYSTLGVRGLRRDNLQLDGGWEQSWREGRWSFGSQWGTDRTGVVLPQSGSARMNRVGARVAGRPARLPAFELAYAFHGQRQRAGGDEREIVQRSDLASVRLRQGGRLGRTRTLTLLSADRLLGRSSETSASHQSSSIQATQMFSLPSQVGLLVRASRTRTVTAIEDGADPDVWSLEGSATWTPGTRLDATAGVTGARSENLRQSGGFVGLRWTLGALGALDAQWSIQEAHARVPGASGFTDRILRVQFLTRGQPSASAIR